MVPYPSKIEIGWQCQCGQWAATACLVTEDYLANIPQLEFAARGELVRILGTCKCGEPVEKMRMLVVQDGFTKQAFWKAKD